jgi:hypothetical protein
MKASPTEHLTFYITRLLILEYILAITTGKTTISRFSAVWLNQLVEFAPITLHRAIKQVLTSID